MIVSLNEKIRYLESQLNELQIKNNELLYEVSSARDKDAIITGLRSKINEL